MTSSTHLSTWVDADTKQRVSSAAARQGLSESALLRRLIEQMLAAGPAEPIAPLVPVDLRNARVTVRHLRDRAERIARALRNGGLQPTQGKARLLETRREVIAGWHAVAEALLEAGQSELAQKIWGFIGAMSPPRTTDEQLVAKLEDRTRTRKREWQEERTR